MTKKRFEICPADEFDAGERRIVTLDGFSVGIFNVDGEYYAMKNDCPHQRAPLSEGKLGGTTESDSPGEYDWVRPGQVVRCPWHGWEFDVTTGESVFNPHEVKAKTFEARVEPAKDGETASDGGCEGCEATLEGDEPPVETYDVEVEQGIVVVYL
ncbi:Rieske (2Fe-2S) protein [Natronorubrum aibiense]|uniref:Rieske 2Fe-2S domain-containing protein n=1 Tax=Natronorubrum aibiense TaxID=348826 RepID=A0A5P9P9A9_9EURY|nr:Rieske (2Fe-2S) protein [Natronorubrum aibiense]QFU84713.1 Rieske 2Fe-2S domain-containing protein [Natronorubrum aibiense]